MYCDGPNDGLKSDHHFSRGFISVLSDAKARKLKAGDKPVLDGTVKGLYLFPAQASGTGKWILRFVSPVTAKRRDMGLGTYPVVSIRDARTRAF